MELTDTQRFEAVGGLLRQATQVEIFMGRLTGYTHQGAVGILFSIADIDRAKCAQYPPVMGVVKGWDAHQCPDCTAPGEEWVRIETPEGVIVTTLGGTN
jgi:hypothetical protein